MRAMDDCFLRNQCPTSRSREESHTGWVHEGAQFVNDGNDREIDQRQNTAVTPRDDEGAQTSTFMERNC